MLNDNDTAAISALIALNLSAASFKAAVNVIVENAKSRPVAKPVVKPATKKVRNLMSGQMIEIAADTPFCCDPSTETYWSM